MWKSRHIQKKTGGGILCAFLVLCLMLVGSFFTYDLARRQEIGSQAASGVVNKGNVTYINDADLTKPAEMSFYTSADLVEWTCAPNIRLARRDVNYGPMWGWESTEQDGLFHQNYDEQHNWVDVTYKRAARMRDNSFVDVKIRFFWDRSTTISWYSWWGTPFFRLGENGKPTEGLNIWAQDGMDSNGHPIGQGYECVMTGYSWYDLMHVRSTYSFYYSDGRGQIYPSELYFKAGSLNPGEGMRPYGSTTAVKSDKQKGAYPSCYRIDGGAALPVLDHPDGLEYAGEPYGSYPMPNNQWNASADWYINLHSNEFHDTMDEPDKPEDDTFWKSCIGLYLEDSSGTFSIAYFNSHSWFAPNLSRLTASADDPSKGIVDGTETKTSVTRTGGDEVIFEISQPVQVYGYMGTGYMKYIWFSFMDTLPDGVEYKSAKVIRRLRSYSDQDVTKYGEIIYAPSSNAISFIFDKDYLTWQNEGDKRGSDPYDGRFTHMLYKGETYTLQITCKLKDNLDKRGSAMSYTIKNEAFSRINHTRLDTNEVSVTQYYDQMDTYVRHRKADGTWEAYANKDSEVICRGKPYSYTWSRGADEPENIYSEPSPKTVGTDASTKSEQFYINVERKKYTYSFDFNPPDSHTVSEITNRQGDLQDKWAETMSGTVKTPALTGYKFLGWNTKADGTGEAYANEKMLSNKTFYARWEARKYKVKYDANGNSNPDHETGEFTQNTTTGTMADSEYQYDIKGSLRPNAYARAGYTFAGWNTKADGTGTSYPDKYGEVLNWTDETGATITLYAQWTKKLGTDTLTVRDAVTNDPVPGVGMRLIKKVNSAWPEHMSGTTNENGQITVGSLHWFKYMWDMTSVPTGYKMAESSPAFTIDYNNLEKTNTITLYRIKYKVKYDANGATNFDHQTGEFTQNVTTGTMTDSEYTYGVKGSLRPNAYARAGYTFNGWNTKADGTGTAYPDGYGEVLNWASGDGDSITLYAQWRKKLGSESITIISEETGNPVAGVTLTLQKNVGGAWKDVPTQESGAASVTTGADGRIEISNLHWFEYRWRVTGVPAGYKKSPSTKFTIKYDNLLARNETILYMKHVSILIDSQVSDIIKGEHAPAFIYHIEGVDAAGVKHSYDTLVQTGYSTKEGTNSVDDIFAGTYTVTQKPVSRYLPGTAVNIRNTSVNGTGVTANVLDNAWAEVKFPYTIREYGWFYGVGSRINELRK